MKINHLFRIALLCLTFVLLVILMTIPLLAKEILHNGEQPIEPENFDIRPIPVPVPPQPFAMNEPKAMETPAPRGPAVIANPVPTPEVAAKTVNNIAQNAPPELATSWIVSKINRQTIVIVILSFTIVWIFVWLHRMPLLYSSNGKNA
jgi:hypothetical protein